MKIKNITLILFCLILCLVAGVFIGCEDGDDDTIPPPPPTDPYINGVIENFNDGVANNFLSDPSAHDWYVSSGMLLMDGYGIDYAGYAYFNHTYSNFTLSVDVAMLYSESGSHTYGYGIYFRSQDGGVNSNAYRLNINASGLWILGYYLNGTWNAITSWVDSPYLVAGEDYLNNITIVCSGDITDIYFNDYYIGYLTSDIFLSGYAGVQAYDPDYYFCDYGFDNFSLSTSRSLQPPDRSQEYNLSMKSADGNCNPDFSE